MTGRLRGAAAARSGFSTWTSSGGSAACTALEGQTAVAYGRSRLCWDILKTAEAEAEAKAPGSHGCSVKIRLASG